MTEPFIGEIQLMAGTQVPSQWVLCDGTELEVQYNTVLFSLIGATYGGNGSTTFRLPNLMGCIPCGVGQGPGLSQRTIGRKFGADSVQLSVDTLPSHSHPMTVFLDRVTGDKLPDPVAGGRVSTPGEAFAMVNGASTIVTAPNSPMIAQSTGADPHENRQPVLGLFYMIAMTGIMPT
jgi:microcystin-dependent protein